MSTHRTATVGLATAALVAGTVVAGATPAQAAPPLERERYASTFSTEFSECGYDFAVTFDSSGTFQLRAGADGGPATVKDQYRFTNTYTNLDTGRSFTTRASGMFRDTRVEPLGGTLYAVTARDSGAMFTVLGDDGRRLYQLRGWSEFRIVVDTSGDDDPGNDEVLEFEYVDGRGPGADTELGGDFCADALALTT